MMNTTLRKFIRRASSIAAEITQLGAIKKKSVPAPVKCMPDHFSLFLEQSQLQSKSFIKDRR